MGRRVISKQQIANSFRSPVYKRPATNLPLQKTKFRRLFSNIKYPATAKATVGRQISNIEASYLSIKCVQAVHELCTKMCTNPLSAQPSHDKNQRVCTTTPSSPVYTHAVHSQIIAFFSRCIHSLYTVSTTPTITTIGIYNIRQEPST